MLRMRKQLESQTKWTVWKMDCENDNDTTIPTSAAVKDFVDGQGFADIGLIIALG